MDLGDLVAAVVGGKIEPVYVLGGPERFLVDRAVEALRRAIDPAGAALNVDVFDGPGASAAKILGTARTLPMFGERRLVLVRQGDQVPPAELEALVAYLSAPAPTTTLVVSTTQIDGRRKFYAEARRRGFVHEAMPIKERQVPSWIAARLREKKLAADPEAVQALAQAIGANLAEIDDAIERLSLYVGPGGRIDADAVAACAGSVRPHTVYELLDAVGAADRGRALFVLQRLTDAREPALKILWWVSRHVRQLLLAREAGRKSPAALAAEIGVPPFIAQKIADQAARMRPADLRRGLVLCAEADLRLKGAAGAKIPDAIVLEQLVVALATRPGAPPAISRAG